MKIRNILFMLLALLQGSLMAQHNPHPGAIDLTPDNSPGRAAGVYDCTQEMTASFNFGVDGLTDYPVCGTGLKFTISLVNWEFADAVTAANNITSTPNWNNLFTFAFAGANTIIATQVLPIPATGPNPLAPIQTLFTVGLKVPITANNGQTLAISVQLTVPQDVVGGCTGNVLTDDIESTTGTVYCDQFLPIQKFELNAELLDKTKSRVSWITLNEINSSKFEVERKIGKNTTWDMIASVPASGLTTESKNYNYIDKFNETAERIYYRIKQIDLDGSSKYTDIKSIATRITSLQIDGFPNPVKDQFQLQIYSKKDEKISMDIVDVLGRLVSREAFTIKEGSNTKNLRLGNFVPGTYFIKVVGTDSNESLTVLKVD